MSSISIKRIHANGIAGIIALFFTMLFSVHGRAQTLSDTLKEVNVRGRHKKQVSNDERINTYSPGQKITSIDSISLQQYQYQSIAGLLSQRVPVFVKVYGVNNIATLNFRGASSAQSQVYWNGVPLQNPALGISDVSLLPVSLMDKVNIVYGSSSALWGSGNIGGALVLENNTPVFDSVGSWNHSVSVVGGSFNQYQAGARSSLHTRRLFLSANVFAQSTRNNFTYTNAGSKKVMDNAALQSGVAMLQAGYKPDDKNTIGITGWYQQYYREIPPALFESSSLKNQRDESLRLLADWKHNSRNAIFYSKFSFINDYMHFQDPAISLSSKYTTQQYYWETGVNYVINKQQRFTVFVPLQLTALNRVVVHDYKYQKKAAIAAAYAIDALQNTLHASASIRGEQINDISVLLPGVNLSYDIISWLSLRANVQKTYRAPTLNELYYVPGGNDKLKPEHGWSADGGYAIKTPDNRKLVFRHDVSYFNRVINDWIIWFGGSIWTPHNIATVYSRGLETENSLQWRVNKDWKIELGLNTAYVLATTTQSYVPNDGSIGKQIPYSPRYNGQANAGLSYKNIHFNYNHTYTGYRFITTDESQYLLPYNTGNVQLLYTLKVIDWPLQLTVQCNNIWNRRYEVVKDRPMPGINFLAGLRVTMQ